MRKKLDILALEETPSRRSPRKRLDFTAVRKL